MEDGGVIPPGVDDVVIAAGIAGVNGSFEGEPGMLEQGEAGGGLGGYLTAPVVGGKGGVVSLECALGEAALDQYGPETLHTVAFAYQLARQGGLLQ